MKTFKFKKVGSPIKIALPPKPQFQPSVEQEQLIGEVRGMKASAPEERLAKALDKSGFQYLFRYSVGAPRNMPGWKELDFLVSAKGMLFPIEVDTAFTHREKANTDVLHDAIVLNDTELNTMGQLYPKVTHADGESDLVNQKAAEQFVKESFGSPMPSYQALPSFDMPQPQTETPAQKYIYEAPQIYTETSPGGSEADSRKAKLKQEAMKASKPVPAKVTPVKSVGSSNKKR